MLCCMYSVRNEQQNIFVVVATIFMAIATKFKSWYSMYYIHTRQLSHQFKFKSLVQCTEKNKTRRIRFILHTHWANKVPHCLINTLTRKSSIHQVNITASAARSATFLLARSTTVPPKYNITLTRILLALE